MTIKKALCGRQPGYFCFWFFLCPLAVSREFLFGFVSVIFEIKCQVLPVGFKVAILLFGISVPAGVCSPYDFSFPLVIRIELFF